MAQGRDERSVQLLVLCSESGWGNGPGMCGDRLLSVKDTLISRATGLGEEDWSCSFSAISVLIVFSMSICTCKPMIADGGTTVVRAREIKFGRLSYHVSYK